MSNPRMPEGKRDRIFRLTFSSFAILLRVAVHVSPLAIGLAVLVAALTGGLVKLGGLAG